MTIGEYIRKTDRRAYNRLINMFKVKADKPKKKIKLGDSIESLMSHDSYSRSKGKIKQRRWS